MCGVFFRPAPTRKTAYQKAGRLLHGYKRDPGLKG